MNPVARFVLIALAVLIGGWVLYATANRVYFSPRGDLLDRHAQATERVRTYESALDERDRIDQALRNLVSRTLGGDVESVDHRLRSRLNRLAEEIGLSGATVSTTSPSARQSPVRSQFRGSGLMREMRDEIDFVELEGSINGEGTIEQVVMLLDRIDAEPWIKRVTSVRLDPKQNGEILTTTIRLVTLFFPGASPEAIPAQRYDPSRLEPFQAVVSMNPFHLPPAPSAASVVARNSGRTGPPALAYGQWFVTGVAEGASGAEAWLLNRQSGESRRLAVGEKLETLELVAAAGEFAVFKTGEERFRVAIGASLNDRTPVNR